MLIGEVLVVLVLFDVAAWIEIEADRARDEWRPLYWLQLAAVFCCVAYGLFALWANRDLVLESFFLLPHVVVWVVVLLPVSVVILAYSTTFALGYWSYHSVPTTRP